MTDTIDRLACAQVSTVPMTPQVTAQLNRLSADLACAKQRTVAWLKHGPTGALPTPAFMARWLQFEEVEAAIANEIRQLMCPPLQLRLRRRPSERSDIAA